MEGSGSLTVERGHLRFSGRKGDVEITGMSRVTSARRGRDFVNRWPSVEYGDERLAMFVDARGLGWAGMLGGNKKLYKAIQAAARQPEAALSPVSRAGGGHGNAIRSGPVAG
jgi:hypothetical protein